MKQLSILSFCQRPPPRAIERQRRLIQPNIKLAFFRARKINYAKWKRAERLFKKGCMLGVGNKSLRRKNIIYYLNTEAETVRAFDILTQERVGICEADHQELSNIEVKPKYLRRGIGSQMLKILNASTPSGIVTYSDPYQRSRFSLTDEGYSLVRSCISKGYLQDEQLVTGMGPSTPCY